MDESAQGLQRLSGETSSALLPDRLGALYAGAMAASRLKDHTRAEAQAQEALQLATTASPREPAAERSLGLLLAQTRLARGDPTAALQALDSLPLGGVGGGARAPLLLRAQATLDLQRSAGGAQDHALRTTTESLQTWVAEHPQDAAAWELLSATSAALGLTLRSMRAGAEARAVVGDLNGAIDRLRVAQQASRGATGTDFIEGSVIDARLRQLTALRRELVLEARGERGARGGPDEPLLR